MAEPPQLIAPAPPARGDLAAASSAAAAPARTWRERIREEPGWVAIEEEGVAPAQDSYTGRQTREFMVRYVTVKENETPKKIAEHRGVGLAPLLEINNARFFGGKLKASSKLQLATMLLIPTGAQGDFGQFTDGIVRATNYQIWLVEHADGQMMELLAAEVQEAVWCYRRITEGWTVATDAPHLGARVRRVFPEQPDPANPGQPYAVGGTLVGYLPPGESDDDFALWHMVHDGGDDDEDLDAAEVEEGITAFREHEANHPSATSPAAAVPGTAPPAAAGAKPGKEPAKRGKKEAAAGGTAKPATKRKAKDKNAPKNPRTRKHASNPHHNAIHRATSDRSFVYPAFVFFHTKVRTDMMEEDPGTSFGLTGKRAGQLWREMDTEAKAQYVTMAEEDKQRYTLEMSTYVYVPPPENPAPAPKKPRGKAVALVPDSSSEESSDESDTSESETDPFQTNGSDAGAGKDAAAEKEAADGGAPPEKKAYDAEWAELDTTQKASAHLLGYSEAQWERKEVPPACVGSHWETDPEVVRTWEELSPEQVGAAESLGYEKWTWDNAMRDGMLPADDADTSMFLEGEECFAFDAE